MGYLLIYKHTVYSNDDPKRKIQNFRKKEKTKIKLFNGNRLGQVTREIHINTSVDSQPIAHQL